MIDGIGVMTLRSIEATLKASESAKIKVAL
jgi:hypothetical protein